MCLSKAEGRHTGHQHIDTSPAKATRGESSRARQGETASQRQQQHAGRPKPSDMLGHTRPSSATVTRRRQCLRCHASRPPARTPPTRREREGEREGNTRIGYSSCTHTYVHRRTQVSGKKTLFFLVLRACLSRVVLRPYGFKPGLSPSPLFCLRGKDRVSGGVHACAQ